MVFQAWWLPKTEALSEQGAPALLAWGPAPRAARRLMDEAHSALFFGERRNAHQALQRAHKLAPADPVIRLELLRSALSLGLQDEAEALIAAPQQRAHGILELLCFACLQASRGRYQEAIWATQRAISLPVSYTHLTLPTILRV